MPDNLSAVGSVALALLLWSAWWLFAVNWRKTWPLLRRGGWAPLALLAALAALVWSRLGGPPHWPAGWWQLGAVVALVAVALLCGWLQGLLRWAPREIAVEPPADHGHGHGHHGHGH